MMPQLKHSLNKVKPLADCLCVRYASIPPVHIQVTRYFHREYGPG